MIIDNETQNPERKPTEIKHLRVLFTLIVGIAGGVIGAVFVAPWYQQNVLHQTPGTTTIERKQVVIDEQSAIISAVEKVNPSVVSIVITKNLPQFEQFDGFFFPGPSGESGPQEVGSGSDLLSPKTA